MAIPTKAPTVSQLPQKRQLYSNAYPLLLRSWKKAETIVEMNKFLNSKESSKIEMSLLANLYLSKCNLELQLKLYSEAVQSCNTVLAKPEKLPESILKNALDFAVFSLTKAGELKKASELIEKHLKSFADVVIAEQQNARLKILFRRVHKCHQYSR